MKFSVHNLFGINLTVVGERQKHEVSESKRNFNGKMHAWHRDYNNAKKFDQKSYLFSSHNDSDMSHNMANLPNSIKQLSFCYTASKFGYLLNNIIQIIHRISIL